MKIEFAGLIEDNKIFDENLMLYLSQIVLTRTNEKIKKSHQEYLHSKMVLLNTISKVKDIKKNLLDLTKELSRVKTLKRVISMIYTLKKEGVLIGKNRFKILDLLDTLKLKDFSSLRTIEENLSIYLPDHNSRSSIIKWNEN